MARWLVSALSVLTLALVVSVAQADSHDTESTPLGAPTPTPTPAPVTSTLSVATGGQVRLGNVTVTVPPGVVAGETQVTANLGFFWYTQPVPQGMVVGTSFELTLKGAQGYAITQLAKPLDLRVQLTDRELAAAGGDYQNIIMGVINEATNAWERIPSTTDAAARTVGTSPDHLTKFSVLSIIPKVQLTGPADGTLITDMAPRLSFALPQGMAQYQIQIVPANNDGPAVNLVRNAESSFALPAPVLGEGNYVLLPGMTYTWRVRATPVTASIGEDHPSWGPWASRTFRTSPPTSATISPVQPAHGARVATRTPVLTWTDRNTTIFYYEVQLSADPAFETDPARATAAVYWNLVHGGQTTPLNTYTLPVGLALDPATQYYWRVRPRVQGDGLPAAWSETWNFITP